MSNETRALLSKKMKEKWRDGNYRARVCVNGSHSEERRAKISEAVRAKWADPNYRNRTISAIRAAHANSSSRSTTVRRGVADQEAWRRKISTSMKRRWQEERHKDRQDSTRAGSSSGVAESPAVAKANRPPRGRGRPRKRTVPDDSLSFAKSPSSLMPHEEQQLEELRRLANVEQEQADADWGEQDIEFEFDDEPRAQRASKERQGASVDMIDLMMDTA